MTLPDRDYASFCPCYNNNIFIKVGISEYPSHEVGWSHYCNNCPRRFTWPESDFPVQL